MKLSVIFTKKKGNKQWNGLISKKDYLLSVLEGSYRTVRRLQEEVNELKAPTAAHGAQGEEITMFTVETIN